MRFTFVILLFCGLGANAQMIIKAHANYRPLFQFSGLLDDYSGAAAAYSLRKLDKDYTGSAIRVRRSNDNTEQDIGFTSSGDLDTAALKTFVGANNGFVTTWYNQADSASVFGIRNAIQTTSSLQPSIIVSGVIVRENGNPTIRFNGSTTRLTVNNSQSTFAFLHRTGKSYVSIVLKNTKLAANGVGSIIDNCGAVSSATGFYMNTNDTLFTSNVVRSSSGNFTSFVSDNSFSPSNLSLITNILDNGNATAALRNLIYKNGTASSVVNTFTNTPSTSTTSNLNLSIGRNSSSPAAGFGGSISEVIIYPSDQSSNRTGIETNINSYYGIY
jgi:hypothetical protein